MNKAGEYRTILLILCQTCGKARFLGSAAGYFSTLTSLFSHIYSWVMTERRPHAAGIFVIKITKEDKRNTAKRIFGF